MFSLSKHGYYLEDIHRQPQIPIKINVSHISTELFTFFLLFTLLISGGGKRDCGAIIAQLRTVVAPLGYHKIALCQETWECNLPTREYVNASNGLFAL